MEYVLLNSGRTAIEAGPMALPTSYGAISNLRALEQHQLWFLGWAPVARLARPAVPRTHRAVSSWRIDVANAVVWQEWDSVELSQGELEAEQASAMEELRTERNRRLAECDWTVLADAPLTPEEQEDWMDYRQELRDMPQFTTDVFSPSWPEAPTAA